MGFVKINLIKTKIIALY